MHVNTLTTVKGNDLSVVLTSLQEGEDQAIELFTDAYTLYQKSIDSYNSVAQSSSKSSKVLFGRAKELELKYSELESESIDNAQKSRNELDHLSTRLDEVVAKTNALSEKIAEEESRRIKLQSELALVQQEQTALMTNFRNFKLTQEQNGLDSQYKAIAARKEEVTQRSVSAEKQCDTLSMDVEKTAKELTELTRRYNGHGHIFTYSGSRLQAGTSGPNK